MKLLKLPPDYRYETGYLYRGEDVISNFVVCPSVLYRRQGEEFPFACDLDIRQNSETRSLHRTLLHDLTDNWWKNPPPGCWYNPDKRSPDKYLKAIFHNCFQMAPIVDVIQATEIGWLTLPTGEKVYITGSEVIGEKPDSYAVWPPRDLEKLSFESASDCPGGEAIQYFWSLFHLIPGVTDILLVYSILSFLSPLFREAGLISRFPVILEGATESKKTTLACLVCGTFARKTNPHSCVVGLTSTRSALELRAEQMRHCTLIVDDLFPDGGRPQQDKALDLIRKFANQDVREVKSGRAVTGSAMDCGVVITAETFPECELSTRNRCLRLKLRDRIPNSMLPPFQKNATYLSNMFQEFLQRVASQYDTLADKVNEDFKRYRDRRSQPDAPRVKSERLAEIGFCLFEALDVLLSIFPCEDSDSIMGGFQRRLNAWIDWQLSPEAVPQFRDIVSEISSLQRQYSNYFKIHQGCFCIEPDKLCMLLCNKLGDYSIERSYVIKCLRHRGALMMDESGTSTKKIGRTRYLHIIPSRLG